MPSDFFNSRQTQSFLNEFIRIVGNTERKKIGGVFRNKAIGGVQYFIYCVFFFASPACIHLRLNKNIDEHTNSLKSQALESDFNLKNPPKQQPLNWDTALELLKKNNTSYNNSLDSIQSARKQISGQWWSILPRLAAFTSISSSISELSNVTSDDISASLVTNLNIPNPVRFYAQRYALNLQKLSAELQHEQLKRRLTIDLCRLYKRQSTLVIQNELLTKRRNNIHLVPVETLAQTITAIETEQKAYLASSQSLRLEINNLLNTPGKHWYLQGSPLEPKFSSPISLLRLGKKSFGLLGFKQQAIQLELSTLQVREARIRRVPQVNLSTSNPPLLSTTGNAFEVDNIQLFAGATSQIEIRDPLGRGPVRDTKQRLTETKAQLRFQAEQENFRLQKLQANYQRLTEQLDSFKSKDPRILPRLSTEQLIAEITVIQSNLHSERNIKNQLQEIELQLWQWDESQW